MKPKAKKWWVKKLPDGSWYAELDGGGSEEVITNAHCESCARVELITQRGGYVDLRGRQNDGYCYSILAVMNARNKRGE